MAKQSTKFLALIGRNKATPEDVAAREEAEAAIVKATAALKHTEAILQTETNG